VEGIFWSARNDLGLDLHGSHLGIYICKVLLECLMHFTVIRFPSVS
jgi:hypothetical protein